MTSASPPLRTQASARERASRSFSLMLCAALVALLLLREGLLLDAWIWAAIKTLPLLAALPGLWRYRLYTYRWLALAVWLYAGEAALHLGEGRDPLLAALRLLLAIGLFGTLSAQIRLRLAAAKSAS